MNTSKAIKVAIAIVISIISNPTFAQTISFSELNDYVQNVRIGLVDEFFDRFNGKTTHPDIPESKPDSRSKNLMMLFDLSQFSSKTDPKFEAAESMMRIVKDDSIKINYSDSTWAALAHCKGTLNGKSIKFDLFLTVQHRRGNMYKWVISKADGSLFDTAPRNNNERIMLLPDDHETNFLSLKRMTSEQPFNVNMFMVNGFDYDKTSAFTYLVHSNLLKIDYVDELEFIFTQIPGYIFHIQYFERERSNAGWLISNFYESSDENKSAFIQSLKPLSKCCMANQSIENADAVTDNTTTDSLSTQKPENLKTMYDKRLKEGLRLIEDYVSFMQREDSLRSKSVYKTKLESLFVNDAKVIVRKGKKAETLSITEFCERVIEKKYKKIEFDSIQVPVWDEQLVTLDPSIYKVEAKSNTAKFNSEISSNDTTNITGKKLFFYKEDTEDGYEWLPIFGDMTLSIK